MTAGAAPPGYEPVTAPHAHAMAERTVAPALRRVLGEGSTLHAWAARQPGARAFQGRDTAWAVALGPEAVVVRHARHGGLLAPVTGDLFRWPTRAPAELTITHRLLQAGIATPAVLAYVVYPARLGFARADVATREVAGGEDLVAVLARVGVDERRAHVLPAVARLLDQLARAGVQHPDLNAKNVLLSGAPGGARKAWVLDTDVALFGRAGDPAVGVRNRSRLLRSVTKRAAAFAAPFEREDVALLGGAGLRVDA